MTSAQCANRDIAPSLGNPRYPPAEVRSANRDRPGPQDEKGPVMSDKSPRQAMSKKSGKSLKDKRADKRVKAARDTASSTEALLHNKKR